MKRFIRNLFSVTPRLNAWAASFLGTVATIAGIAAFYYPEHANLMGFLSAISLLLAGKVGSKTIQAKDVRGMTHKRKVILDRKLNKKQVMTDHDEMLHMVVKNELKNEM